MPTVKKKAPASRKKKPSKKKPQDKTAEQSAGREVKYDYEKPKCHITKYTADKAKSVLGWIEPKAGEKWSKTDRHYYHELCGSVRFAHNVRNRYINQGRILELMQEILRKRWRLNCEPVIIGKTGLVLNGQKTLIAVVLSALEYHKNSDSYPQWKEEPWIEKLTAVGVDEDDDVVNTLDTAQPRTDADVIYINHFQEFPAAQRQRLSRALASSVRLLWYRTGSVLSRESFARSNRKTLTETQLFIERHPRLKECVQRICKLDHDGRLNRTILSSGYAAAMLYLMSSSASDSKAYRAEQEPSERSLKFTHWREAVRFWEELVAEDPKLEPIREVFSHRERNNLPLRLDERCGILAKAWQSYPKLTKRNILLSYMGNGSLEIKEHPRCGGIDLGPHPEEEDSE